MTRLEPHRCDVCGDLFYVPEDPLRTLEINRGQSDEIDYDICYDCHAGLLKWILKIREQKRNEAEPK